MFNLKSKYKPTWDQPEAIKQITYSLKKWNKYQTLLWVTGSGKTFTMANIIKNINKPTLILAHNKTLAAQLAQEFKEFFPDHAVHYFVSYYDYYQPEAYIAKTDTYIEKEATINQEISRLRHAATESLLTRKDVIIVSSVSCIYWIWEIDDYLAHILKLKVWESYSMEDILTKLIALQYKRSREDFTPWMFNVLWDVIDIYPASRETVYSLEFFGDELDVIREKNPMTNEIYDNPKEITIFPAKHMVTTESKIKSIIPKIRKELEERANYFYEKKEFVKEERLRTKVEFDIEMMLETGYVNWIENYSMYLWNRNKWDKPTTLMNYFWKDYLMFIDESHITIPQIWWMYAWDRARKTNLIENWFRLESAYENRPLKFDEFESNINQAVFVSATPSKFEEENQSLIATQVIRPTGLLDPVIEVEDMEYMVDSIMKNLQEVILRWERALITTITKASSESLADYLANNWIKVKYLHSEVDTMDRLEILRDLRIWKIDVIVWVNLLREWLDLPEVSYVAILDAEKWWFLRSERSLIQIIWRAARNVNWKVIMYSQDKIHSDAMKSAIKITNERRKIQKTYNIKHNITPTTIKSSIKESWKPKTRTWDKINKKEVKTIVKRLEIEMEVAIANQDFETAAELRDEIILLWKR